MISIINLLLATTCSFWVWCRYFSFVLGRDGLLIRRAFGFGLAAAKIIIIWIWFSCGKNNYYMFKFNFFFNEKLKIKYQLLKMIQQICYSFFRQKVL
jgi:hypothetical protein